MATATVLSKGPDVDYPYTVAALQHYQTGMHTLPTLFFKLIYFTCCQGELKQSFLHAIHNSAALSSLKDRGKRSAFQ